jgi:hypothetical protein
MQILESDRTRFLTGGTSFLTQDEENSGVIDVSNILGKKAYLAVTQAHYAISGELVEGGQLYLVTAPVPEPETYAMMVTGLALLGTMAKRKKQK